MNNIMAIKTKGKSPLQYLRGGREGKDWQVITTVRASQNLLKQNQNRSEQTQAVKTNPNRSEQTQDRQSKIKTG